MKKVEAIFRHSQLDDVKNALDKVGVKGMTITEVKGAGKQKGYTETWRGSTVTIFLRPKVKLETVVPDDIAEVVVNTIAENARTGSIGDGKIFISSIEEAVRIRTGEKGDLTLA
jgi:nitrogen regulatory protein P-II 1